jgi:hypothetical protein
VIRPPARASVFEYEVDADGNYKRTFTEWKQAYFQARRRFFFDVRVVSEIV